MLIPSYVEKNARLFPNKIAVIFQEKKCTYKELQSRIYKLANALLGLGVAKGDRVAVILENCFEYLEICLAIEKIGGVITPINFRLIESEIISLVDHAEANTLFIGGNFVEKLRPFVNDFATVKNYISVGRKTEVMMSYEELLSSFPENKPSIEIIPEDLFCLCYTGGTTGTPKGVMITHRNMLSACTNWIIIEGVPRGVAMVLTPIFHIASFWTLLFNFMLGNTVVIVQRVDPKVLLETVEKEKVNYTLWHSSVIANILNYPNLRANNLDSLKLVNCGGGPLSKEQFKTLIEVLRCTIHYSGGMTETGTTTCVNVQQQLKDDPETLGSAGRETFNLEVRIVDEQDKDVPPSTVGELCVRGESVYKGYWKRPEETEESFRGGWFHTGDLLKMDSKGYLYYVDRKKDIIITGGEQVYSQEVEKVIYDHPSVFEAAVISVPDEKWGEAVKAVVVLKENQLVAEEEIIRHCKKYLAGYKCPKTVEFWDELPKTPLGKIGKQLIRRAIINRCV